MQFLSIALATLAATLVIARLQEAATKVVREAGSWIQRYESHSAPEEQHGNSYRDEDYRGSSNQKTNYGDRSYGEQSYGGQSHGQQSYGEQGHNDHEYHDNDHYGNGNDWSHYPDHYNEHQPQPNSYPVQSVKHQPWKRAMATAVAEPYLTA